MRRVWALAVGGALLLAGCDGGDGSRRAERARPASATGDVTTTTASSTTATEFAADGTVTTAAPTAPAGTAAGSTGSVGSSSGGNASSRPGGVPGYGGSVAPGEPHPSPPRPPGSGTAHPWQSYSVSPDGRTLTFTYYAGVEPCSVFDRVDVRESPTYVIVTIYERNGARPDQACVMMAQEKHARAVLQSPVGGRRVVDGAASPPPPYPGPQPPPPGPPPQPPPQPPPSEPRPPCCKNPNAVRWESYSASPDGRTLTFTYWSGVDECTRLDHVAVDESASRVVVTIYERDVTNGNPCIAMAQQKHATANLQAPLGNRAVIDGAA